MADRGQASHELAVALRPFAPFVNLAGDRPPGAFPVTVPDSMASPPAAPAGRPSPATLGADDDEDRPRQRQVHRESRPRTVTAPGPSRWLTNGHAFTGLMAWPVPVGGGQWKPLGDCDHEDLAAAADHYRGRSDHYGKRAAAFTRLRETLLTLEEDTVGELAPETVKEVLG
jgi:hypothetical protein